MIEFEQLSLLRGGKTLLENADLRLHDGERVALIGANGSGKSSLFALLRGELEPDTGSVRIPPNWRIAHMAQEVSASSRAAVDYVIDGHEEFRKVEAELSDCGDDMRLAELHGQLDALNAYAIPSQAEQLLLGLGFKPDQLQTPVREFSGGWRIRLNLAQALMRPSDLLLLDEPTNHLDMDATLWLEQWLQAYSGTLLLISHDRDFIDATCNQVAHLSNHSLTHYRGNYSAFERQRAEKLAQQQSAYEKQQAEIAHMENFIRRFKAKATKARQAQSRIKALERMTQIAPAHVDSPFSFTFPVPEKMSDPLLTLTQATLGYGDTPILRDIKLSVHPGSRIGLLGANGAGKSTLLKTLGGVQPLLAGQRTRGEHLALGYFSQHQLESLDLDASPATQLQRLAPKAREQEILNFLGSFNIRGDMASGSCRNFSGGEKARLALAIIVWQKPNLLLLDEPTNHLDLEMCQALTVALQGFEGALIVVSHDRHLLRNTVDDLLLVNAGRATPYDGDLDDYRRWLLSRDSTSPSAETTNASKDASQQPSPSADKNKSPDKKQARQDAAAARARLAPLRKQIKGLEAGMDKAQRRLAELEESLADTSLYEAANKARLQELLKEQGELRQQLESQEEEWLLAQEEMEQAQS
ncbi:ATP-binding cassette subfamily F protein 3 [Litorivivens lipolytica]|uniref:Probable ATP-binding protein YheS n=1 Tax=Litorivivens lipolytica TaxID=1524264 RepID=A0A7W4W6W8_9GAMM|nr:ATP-binding cassette domain-containing protein [Litorivivens lipolytica]MBB3048562.1 ATP-binding cassette subfamily F protein 3 [Litorivivens lipolytica]